MRTRKASSPRTTEAPPDPSEMRKVLASFRDAMGGTQAEVGALLGIDQGQMSKILKGDFTLPTGHALALFAYAKTQLAEAPNEPVDREVIETQLTKKVLAAWDGTREGATALGVMLEGAARLCAPRSRSTT